MDETKVKTTKKGNSEISRRNFLKISKDVMVGIGAGGVLTNIFWVNKGIAAIPVSEGYLLVDVKKCQGCLTCPGSVRKEAVAELLTFS